MHHPLESFILLTIVEGSLRTKFALAVWQTEAAATISSWAAWEDNFMVKIDSRKKSENISVISSRAYLVFLLFKIDIMSNNYWSSYQVCTENVKCLLVVVRCWRH